MIQHGVNAALIPHTAGDNPVHTAAMIGDQQDAIESVFCIREGRPPIVHRMETVV